MTAKIDILNSSSITLNRDGYRASRIALVSNVSGTAEQVLYNAINDAQLPDIGDAHPDVSTITLQDISCKPLGNKEFQIVMNYYKDVETGTVAASAQPRATVAVAVEESNLDINGVQMSTRYKKVNNLVEQRFTAEVERPRLTFDFTYKRSTWPTSELTTYAGKLNSIAWNGYPAKTILCTGINVNPEGDEYAVNYNFAYRPEGWQYQAKTKFAAPLSPHPTDPDNDLDLNQGIKVFDVYSAVDFTALSFTFDSVGYSTQYLTGVFRVTGSDATLTVA